MSDWQRVHPASPLLRMAQALAVLVVALAAQRDHDARVLGVLLAGGALLVLPFAYLSWRFTRYRIHEGELQIDSGVLVRRARRIPLARLQAVDVVRPLLARVFGLAELRLEVVGGSRTEAPLAYLAEGVAERERARLLALAHGVAEETPAPPEVVVAHVDHRLLLLSLLLEGQVVLTTLLLTLPAVVVTVLEGAATGATVGVPLLLSLGPYLVQRLNTGWDFTAALSPDGLRLRHGLLDTRSQTVPLDRIQAVEVQEPLLWRALGWARVRIDVAGYSNRNDQQSAATSTLLPVGPRETAWSLADAVLGGVQVRPDLPAPGRARRLDPVQWSALAIRYDDRHLASREGWLRRVTTVVPMAKAQSVRLLQGPVERSLGLATVCVDTAGRKVRARALHRDEAEARELVEHVAVLARGARGRARRPG